MKFYTVILLVTTCFLFSCSHRVNIEKHENDVNYADERGDFRIVSYNVENYFDQFDDSLTNDKDFTPDGSYHWAWNKYKDKQQKIYKVIAAVGGWELPDIIGLAEVENQFVLEDLINSTPLKWRNYGIVHKESPDRRGIDVAVLYRKEKFTLLGQAFYKIQYPWDMKATTRDILYIKGVTRHNDTLHVFMNHWPSKYGGQTETDRNRMFVASFLKTVVDSIFSQNIASNVIIMGDFNEEPENENLFGNLNVSHTFDAIQIGKLYNLGWYMKNVKNMGSLKFQGQWGLIDQFIVSGSLLMNTNSIYTSPDNAHVFNADFLSEKDETYIGVKPYRTFIGFKYNGGFSDHYPIYLDFFEK